MSDLKLNQGQHDRVEQTATPIQAVCNCDRMSIVHNSSECAIFDEVDKKDVPKTLEEALKLFREASELHMKEMKNLKERIDDLAGANLELSLPWRLKLRVTNLYSTLRYTYMDLEQFIKECNTSKK